MASPNRSMSHDYATGKPIDLSKPEEPVRQNFERTLHQDYGYDTSQIDIEVYIQRGTRRMPRSNRERADIVIYQTTDTSNRDQFRDILGIVETKRPNRNDGLRQLMSYMTASSAQWGVWTNGDDIEHVYRDPITGEPRIGVIFDLPRRGESVQDIGRLSKSDLVPAQMHSLKPIFNRILNTLYSNSDISRREKLGSEMIRLIFTKIWDERFHLDRLPEFRVGIGEDPRDVKERICALFDQVKMELVDDGVFDEGETITLDANSVAWVVGQLERYSLSKTDKDVVGDAFEVFAEPRFIGDSGEFFTPREVVRIAIDLVNPQPDDIIFDPACGSGGFLIHALERVWELMDNHPRYRNSPMLSLEKQRVAQRCFFGIDKEVDLVKIAKAHMAIAGDGRGGIAQQNSLHSPQNFQGRAREMFTRRGELRQFDVIFTNPPFGVKIKVAKEEASQFSLGHRWKRLDDGQFLQTDTSVDTDPQVLFIERCLQMLKDGGTLAIVLPETIFHAVNSRYVLHFILRNNNVKAVVDLPHNTFRPHNNAKTCLMVVQKGVPQQQEIIMAVAEEMGHDHNGRPLFRFDADTERLGDQIWDDLAVIRSELSDPSSNLNEYTFMVKKADIRNDIYVPRYYWPKARKTFEHDHVVMPVSIRQLLDEGIIEAFQGHGSPKSEYKGRGEIPYIRVSDIVNWELYRNPTSGLPNHEYHRIKGPNGVTLRPQDIVFVRRGSYRIGTVAMASHFDSEVLLTRELVVLRVVKPANQYGINPYYLLLLLSHRYTQEQISQKVFIDTTLPNIGDRWQELLLPIHADPSTRRLLINRVRTAINAKWQALDDLAEIRREFGHVTT